MLQIGSLKMKNSLIMAPLAGITNLPFRLMVKKLGAGLVTTEMVSAMGLAGSKKKTFNYLRSDPAERPLAVQIFGSDPETMARAAEIVVGAGADIVDINMGCPAKKVLKTGSGGALLRSPEKKKQIVSAVRRAINVPLTVKIRAGWTADEPVAVETARLIEDCGADAVTIHPRFVKQGFTGNADWSIIEEVKQHVMIPVIGNGDVFKPSLALDMKEQTGCDGVMIGRGAIGNPWIFRQILESEKGLTPREPELSERRALIMEHFSYLSLAIGENRAAKMMRGLLLWYTKGLPHSSRFRGTMTSIKNLDTLVSALDQYFSFLEDRRL
ncbi:MAG: tRNA dihydrouridine synthase DusB [Deltaproteobacteria bacterium]|nr:tRNA dihydrouridine synthase DusB [Deltaproteobacteria bacterium]MBW2117956.1 tRNA dihydrouridine synthase DusB [Deltaproteobacteria bacterium]MBW2343603.1 tRNA dihydrouridine synthase DusB [Deltaproteobacteria bacterium]